MHISQSGKTKATSNAVELGGQNSSCSEYRTPHDAIAECLDDVKAILTETQMRVLEEGIQSITLYGCSSDRELDGDDLKEALRRYDGVAMIQERIIELRGLQPTVQRFLDADPNDVDAKLIEDERVGLECILLLNGLSLLRCLRNTAFSMGLDPTPFTIVQENLSTETRATALGLAELMSLEIRRLGKSPEPVVVTELNQAGEPALTKSQQTVLKTISRFGASILLSTSRIRDEMDRDERLSEETIRLAVNALLHAELVERPQGPRHGCRLTLSGRKLVGKIAD